MGCPAPRSVWSSVALAVLLVACGPAPGERFAGWKALESGGGQYRLRYLSPPWHVTGVSGTTSTLQVELEDAPFVPGDLELPPTFQLVASVQAGSALARAQADAAAAAGRMERVLAGPRRVVTDSSAEGWELLTRGTREDALHFRFVYFDRASSGVVRLLFSGTPSLDDPEIDVMIASVEIDVL